MRRADEGRCDRRAVGKLATFTTTAQARERWTIEEAQRWGQAQPWLIGSNFIPSTAINQLEMWQAETFDPPTIERELGWASEIGYNTVRVYLPDLLWNADRKGFLERVERGDRNGRLPSQSNHAEARA